MTITGINHGLSVYTGADDDMGAATADNRRLRRPVDGVVTNCFNDATSVFPYHKIYKDRGHQGIDFDCEDASVVAMYGGVVIETKADWPKGGSSIGNYVKIRSCTDLDDRSGFEHAYLHLKSVAVDVGQSVTKGQVIGVSGDTGTSGSFHLHVHLRPFDSEGEVPSPQENSAKPSGWELGDPLLPPVRVRGSMNFACFLPPDAQTAVNNHTHVPAPIASGTAMLLSPRDAYAVIPVHGDNNGERGSATGRTIHGKYLACYAVLGTAQVGNTTWYRIQYEAGTATNPGIRWVSSTVTWDVDKNNNGTVEEEEEDVEVVWVHVEEVPDTMPKVQTSPHFLTTDATTISVYSLPSTAGSVNWGSLAAGRCHAITGTYWDRAANMPDTHRRWWRIPHGTHADGTAREGWVRDDKVGAYGGRTGVPAYTGSGVNPRVAPGTPKIDRPTVVEESVTVRWTSPKETRPVTGYRIWRGPSPENLNEVHRVKAGTTFWTDQTPGSLGTLYYYAVSGYWTGTEGERSPAVGVVTGQGTVETSAPLVVSEMDINAQPAPHIAASPNFVMQALRFRRPTGVLWQNQQPVLLAVELPSTGPPASGAGGAAGPTTQEGWVPASAVKVLGTDGSLPKAVSTEGIRHLAQVAARSHLRLRSWVTGLNLRTGPSTAFTIHALLTDTNAWYAVTGRTATIPVWYRLRYGDTFQGWVHGAYVEISEAAPAITAVTPPAEPAAPGPANEAGTGTETTTGSAVGDFRNLVTNPDGRWAVWKAGTTVTANFGSPRSPVQYHARQNPQLQFVLPAGFRPAATATRTVSGSQVNADRTPVPNAPRVSFDLTIGTNGEMRYVNNSKVDHLGYVGYNVTGMTWQSNETLTVPAAPARPGDIEDSGVYLNQQVNWGSSWELERRGNAVSGSFGCTRSPVDYFANGAHRAAQLLLPEDYRPKANARFQVKGAVRVNADGSDSTDTRKVDFWLTVQPNGQMWYDADTNLQTLGVGYLRYTVNVSWTAAPRITVPGVPRDLEAEDIEATELELDWRRPAEDGGAAIDGYRIQVWDADDTEWDTEESDTNSTRTRHDVEDLAPYTTYRFRVAAHNRAGWGAFCPAITATTRRRAPGAPASLSATAAHDAVTLNWGTASGTVTGYTLARRTGSGTWNILVADTGVTTRDFVDRTVSPATAYRYRVRGHNRGEAGAWSPERSIATAAAPTIPGRVTGLAVAPGTGSRLQLTWTAPTDTGGGITGHRIERSPDITPRTWTVVREDTGSDTASWGDDDVAADTAYHYRVSASNSAGTGTPSAEAAGRSRPQLHLGGRLPYPLAAHASPWADAPVTATFAAYLPGRAYDLAARVPDPDGWWRVLLFGQGTTGPFWLPAAAGTALGDTAALPQPPAAPQNLAAALAQGRVTLTWSAPPAGTAFTGQRLWRQRDHEAWTPLGDDLGTAARTHTDDTVQNGHVYRYRLQSLADTGPGRPSNPAGLAVMTTPAAPAAVTGLQATATTTSLQLAWTRAATGGLPTAYRVRWRVDGTADDFRETEVIGTAHTLTGLTPGTAHDLRVVAFNQVGEAPAATRTATTVQVVPGVPEDLAVAVTGGDAAVTWRAPATGGPPDEYRVQHKHRDATDWPETHTAVTGLTHALVGLAHDTAHDLRLRAANAAGVSDWVTATFTTAPAPRVPGTPATLTAAPGPDSQMQLAWTAPAATGTGPVTGYRIERSPDTEPRAWTAVAADTGSAATTWHDAGLAADTAYRYRVTGRNAEGLGSPSTEAVGRTRPQARLRPGAAYPLTARAWLEADAPATHTWNAHDDAVVLDVAAKGPNDGWWRVLRFGQAADGPCWLPAGAVAVTGATADLPQAPGTPGDPTATATHETVTLAWTAPAHGGAVTGQRLWRQAGEGAWTVLGDDLAADVRTHTDTSVAAATAYRYRVQALGAQGAGPRSVAVAVATPAPPPLPGVPRRLSAAVTGGRVRLLWRPPAAGDPVTGYRLWRRTGTDGPFVRLGDDLGPRAEGGIGSLRVAFDATAAAGAAYAYRVQALGAHGAGPLTDPVAVTLP